MKKIYLSVRTMCKCNPQGDIIEEGKMEILGAYSSSDAAHDRLEESYFDLCGRIDMHRTVTKGNVTELIDCDSDTCYLFKVLELNVA